MKARNVYRKFFPVVTFGKDKEAWVEALQDKKGILDDNPTTEVHDLVGYRPMTTGGAYVLAPPGGEMVRAVREEGEICHFPLDADSELAQQVRARLSVE